jgi:hypothetical protein
MPWRTESVMDQRVEFVIRAEEGEEGLAELCREYESAGRPGICGCTGIGRWG